MSLQEELNPDRNLVRNDAKLFRSDNVAVKRVTQPTPASKYSAFRPFRCVRLPVAAKPRHVIGNKY